MRVRWLIPVALVALPTSVPAEVYVKAQKDRITVRAQREPLARVLAGIARETGLAVTYQSPAPNTLVSLTLENVTPQEAVMRLFEGQGLNYIFTLDPTQSKVAMLIITGGGTAARPAVTASARPTNNPQNYAEEEPVTVEDDAAEPEEEVVEHPDVPDDQMKQDQNQPGAIGLSGSQWNPPPGGMVLPGQPAVGFPGGTHAPTPGSMPGQPGFPGGASMGGPPQQPPQIPQPITPPRFPGGASQPQD
jgi:hypothetical protein